MPRPTAADSGLPEPPFRHPLRVASLSAEEGEENSVRLSPHADARERIARFLGLEAVERLTLSGRLTPLPDGWEFRGQLTATVLQTCVVTLEPVRGTIDTGVRRRYVRDLALPQETERVLEEAELDPPEPLGEEIDLGHVAVEALALSLDPWPRAEGTALEPGNRPGAAADAGGAEGERPFAALAELRARLTRGND